MLRPIRHIRQVADDTREEFALLLLQGFDAFFDGARGNHAVDEHAIALSDTVHAIDGLGFDSRVPPRVEQEDILGSVERDARAACFERGQEQGGALGGFERFDGCAAVFGFAG